MDYSKNKKICLLFVSLCRFGVEVVRGARVCMYVCVVSLCCRQSIEATGKMWNTRLTALIQNSKSPT